MTKKPLIVLVILMGLCSVGYAQKKEISLELGAGNTNMNNHFEVVYPLKRYYDAFYQAGVKYTVTPADKPIDYYTGLTLDKKNFWSNQSDYFLKVPVGFHLNYGNKLKFHIGVGLNGGFYLGSRSFNRFTLGTFLNTGPSLQLSENYRIMLSCQFNFDLTPMMVESGSSMAGGAGGADYSVRSYDGFLVLGLYRKLPFGL